MNDNNNNIPLETGLNGNGTGNREVPGGGGGQRPSCRALKLRKGSCRIWGAAS